MPVARPIPEPRTFVDDPPCAGKGHLFFPVANHTHLADDDPLWAEPRRLCGRCPAAAACLAYALRNHEKDGMWGGTTPRQRNGRYQ